MEDHPPTRDQRAAYGELSAAPAPSSPGARTVAMLQDLLDAMEEGAALWDEDLKFILCNKRYRELMLPEGFRPLVPGESARQLGIDCFSTDHFVMSEGQSPEARADAIVDVIRSYVPELDLLRQDGHIIQSAVKQTALGGYLITARDVTAERKSDQRARDMLYESFQSIDTGMILCDDKMHFVFANDTWLKMTFDNIDVDPPQRGDNVIENLTALVKAGHYDIPEGQSEEEYIEWMMGEMAEHGKQVAHRLADGRHLVGSSHKTSFGGSLMFVRDVTQMHESEERVRASRLEAIETLDQSIALIDKDGTFSLANKAWHDMWLPGAEAPSPGDTPQDIIQRQIELFPGMFDIPDVMTTESFVQEMLELQRREKKHHEMPMGDGRIILGSSHRTKSGGFLLTFDDVTEKRREKERLLASITDAMQSLSNGIALFDADLRYIVGNDRYLAMWFPEGIALPKAGETIGEIAARVLAAGHMKLPKGMKSHTIGDDVEAHTRRYAKNLRIETQDRSFLATVHPSNLGGYLPEFNDITQRLKTEEELARSREIAHQNEKLSALGELLAGVAHELNNPLSVVFGYSQMLQGKITDPLLAERVDLICQSAERAAKIVKTFLAMARQRPTKVEKCSVNEIAATALEVSSYSLKTNGTLVETDFDEAAPPVSGDFDQLAQVFSNLIINAGHAVETRKSAGKILVRSFFDKASNETVVEIRDNGPGIPPEIQTRIFEPFFTTKEVGEGTGVGLAFSHRIVQSHGGVLSLVSEPTRGTQFFVRLQVAEDSGTEDDNATQQTVVKGVRTVLIVDDEAGVARLIRDLLMEEGFTVTTTTSPRDALNRAAKQGFDVILSDFKMPDMDGARFYGAMQVLAPQQANRIGFVTGDAMSSNVVNFLAESGRPYIEKPIIKSELLSLLARAAGLKTPVSGSTP